MTTVPAQADAVETPKAAAAPPKKIIVALHGIGDQVRCETVQAVAAQFCSYYHLPASIPLGHFHAKLVPQGASQESPAAAFFPGGGLPAGLGFAEAYWADIPRALANDRYDLEESKKWGMTLVERVRKTDPAGGRQIGPRQDYIRARTVIAELVEGIQVLENVLFLADRAKLFEFDLKQVLVDYLGDVQVVADFENIRQQIVEAFLKVMARIRKDHPSAEIFIVAHSEGTVVALLGILDALCRLDSPGAGDAALRSEWVLQLRGLMTIGSPLNKHVFLWPELWTPFARPPKRHLSQPIRWRNYFDYGDPVGFRLDAFRTWLKHSGWVQVDGDQPFIQFDAKSQDVGFTRYLFPGKAHVDYWTDEGVFWHFIEDVVQPPAPQPARAPVKAPGTRWFARIVSCLFPFVMALGSLLAGSYLLCKAVDECVSPAEAATAAAVATDVTAVTLILAGFTAVARIPRLTHAWRWRLGGVFFFLASAGGVVLWGFGTTWLSLILFLGVTLVLLVCRLFSHFFPASGAKPLITVGAVIVVGIVLFRTSNAYDEFLAIKDTLSFPAESSADGANETDEGNVGGPQPRGDFRGARPGWASLELLGKYAVSNEPAQNLKSFVTNADPAQVTKMLRLEATDAQVSAVRDTLKRFNGQSNPQRVESAVNDNGVRNHKKGPIWPVITAGVAFLYLWWLAAILFDLTVIWHHFIRQSAILDQLKLKCRRPWQ